MKIRIAALLLVSLIPSASYSWVELGSYYQFGAIPIRLGDVCDAARFPLTPGDCSGTAGNPDWRVELTEALGRWEATTTNIAFIANPGTAVSVPGECNSADPNSVYFMDTICDLGTFGDSTLAVAVTSFFFDGVSLHSDIIFNSAFTWGAFDDALSNHPGVIDFTRVAVHESGHVAGLGHPAHQFAIMAPIIQDVTNSPQPDDLAGLAAIYGATHAVVIPDQNGNGAQELASIRRTALGVTTVEVRDSVTDSLLSSLTYFDATIEPVDLVLISDEDSSGSAEIGVLGLRYSDQRALVEIRNISGPLNTRRVYFTPGVTPIQLKNIGDADGNGVDELAVLGVRESDIRSLVDIRNSIGAVGGRTIYLSNLHSPIDFEIFPNPGDPDTPRIAVLLRRWSDFRSVIEMRNSIGAQQFSRVFTSAVATPASFVIYDSAAGARLAVLSTRDSDFRTLIELSGIDGSARSNQYFTAGNTPLELATIGDADADGQQDLAVLSSRDSDGRVIVEARNPDGSNRRTLYMSAGFDSTGSLSHLDDADGDTFEEIVVLLSRQTDARRRIDWRNAAGPNTATTNTVWQSP